MARPARCECISVGDLAQKIVKLMQRRLLIVIETQRLRPPGSEVMRLRASNRRAREFLGWKPSIALEEGLARAIAWNPENLERYRLNEREV